ncbi:MAG: AzlD domain-containing protein [Rhodobacteraceae bacterium]|nr:AzlD domain-containing protein [Paracoccaceae bacterium]
MLSSNVFIASVCVMAASVLMTRFSGAMIMAKLPPTPWVERFLNGLSVSVIAALVASALAQGAASDAAAVAGALLVMWVKRDVVLSMAAGMAISALCHLAAPA